MADSQHMGDGPPAKRQKVASPSLTPNDNAGKNLFEGLFSAKCLQLHQYGQICEHFSLEMSENASLSSADKCLPL